MEKINKIIFIKHMNLKLQYISIKLLIGVAYQGSYRKLMYYSAPQYINNRKSKRVDKRTHILTLCIFNLLRIPYSRVDTHKDENTPIKNGKKQILR